MDIDNITEDQAIQIVNDLRYKFRWNMTFLTTQNIVEQWKRETGRDITEEELDNVITTFYWRHMDDYMYQDAISGLQDAIYEAQNEAAQ